MRDVPPELIAAKITRTPLILSKNILAEQGIKIAADLEKLGASAAFIRHAAGGTDMKQPLAKPSPAPGPPPNHGGKKWGRYVLASIFLVFSLSFLSWRLYLYNQAHRGYGPEKPHKLPQISRIDFTAYRAVSEEAPSVMDVAPQDMYQAFLYQYRLRPDTRFIKAFKILAERFGEYHSRSKGKS
ncbi:MAG: hypothetical protein ACE5NJ_10765, partial [Thermodesulfobacteriota bacterium]